MQRIIDISHYQTVKDWGKIAQNVDAVILKATQGHGLSSSSYLFTDSKFHEFAKAAIAHNIPLGVYHFFTGSTAAKAINEADYFYDVIAPYRDKLMFAVCDAENYNNKWLLGLSRQQLTANINTFCSRMEAHGIPAVHYTNVDHINSYIDIKGIPYPCWCASYGRKKPTGAGDKLVMWQYSDKGKVSGILNNVDMNHGYFGEVEFAIYRLQAAGVINTPRYWVDNYDKLQYLDVLLTRCAARIKSASGKSCGTLSEALQRLQAAGIVDTPAYWQTNAAKMMHLPALLMKLGGAV